MLLKAMGCQAGSFGPVFDRGTETYNNHTEGKVSGELVNTLTGIKGVKSVTVY